MIYNIEFKQHKYTPNNFDGIDSDRYIIPFIIRKRNQAPHKDDITEHIIQVEIDGTTLSTEGIWNCDETEIPKIIFAHAFEYIKSLIIENKLLEDNYLKLDEYHLTKYPIDPNKIPEINQYNFDFKFDGPKKKFGF